MTIRWYHIVIFLGFLNYLYSQYQHREIHHPIGVMIAPDDPQQTDIKATPFRYQEYEITPQATFSLKARALSVERYKYDRGAELAPIDIAFGWGAMSDEKVLSQINISQGGRFYHWRVEQFPIPAEEIISHSANMHLIPANDTVKDKLFSVSAGALVKLTGKLVNVRRSDGFYWNSSLTRNDSGAGACELIYVEDVQIE